MHALVGVLGDLTEQHVDVLVTPTSTAVRGGGGVDGAVHRAAGPQLLAACVERMPHGLPPGGAGWTPAGDLPAHHVVHVVGPDHRDPAGRDPAALAAAYRTALALADDLGARTAAMPLLGTGLHAWPLPEAVEVAVHTLLTTPSGLAEVRLVAVDPSLHRTLDLALARRTPHLLLHGVRALHRRGFEQVRLSCGMSPSGMHWRAEITAGGSPLHYTTADGTAVAAGTVSACTRPAAVGDVLLAGLPGAVPSRDPAYAAWFDHLVQVCDRHDAVPVAFGDHFDPAPGWEIGWGSGVRVPGPPV